MRKSTQFALLVSFILLGLFSTLGYQDFLYLQAQNISHLSVFNQVFKPLSGLVLLSEILLACTVAAQIVPGLFERGQQGLIIHASVKPHQLVTSILLVIFCVTLIPLAYFGLIGLIYLSVSPIDMAVLISNAIGLLLGGLMAGTFLFSVSLFMRRTLATFVICFVAIIAIFVLDEIARTSALVKPFSIYLDLFLHFREGLIWPVEILRWFFWLALFYAGALLALQRLQKNTHKSASLLSVFALLSIVFIGVFSNTFFEPSTLQGGSPMAFISRWDISQAKNNSLNLEMANKLKSIDAPVKIIAVIDKEESHDEIKQGFGIVQQYLVNSSLTFSSRQSDGKENSLAEQYVAIEINGHRQSIRYPFDKNVKDSLVDLILQLTTRGNQWITFLEGHGEASPFAKTSRDLGQFYQSIKDLGWPVAAQNLTTRSKISRNTKVLIIAASQQDWLPTETLSVIRYLQEGGNLLLLREQNDRLPGELLSYLGISTEIGILIDWQGYQSGTPHPAVLIVNQFNDHPINIGINSLLAFPWSQALILDEKSKSPSREYSKILETHAGVWTEYNSDQEKLSFNQDTGELQQSFPIGYSMVDKRLNQRIVVMGDSSFLSDSAINNYANRQFSLNIVSWLASQKSQSVDRPHQDSYIKISPVTHFVLSWLFSLILPLIAVFFAFVQHLKIGQK